MKSVIETFFTTLKLRELLIKSTYLLLYLPLNNLLTLSLKTTAKYILKSNCSAKDSRFRRSCDRNRLSVADFLEAGSAIREQGLYNQEKLTVVAEKKNYKLLSADSVG